MGLVDLGTASADVGDAYTSLVQLLQLPFVRGRMVDATLTFNVSGVTLFYGQAAPAAAAVGQLISAGGGLAWAGTGPGWRLDWIYLKETTAGGGAVVVLQGVVNDQVK